MSERAAMAGVDGPAHTLVHKGRTYSVQPVITEGVMLAVEARLYDRAKDALLGQRDMMSADMYERKLDELGKQYLRGEFSFESKQVMEFLKTQKGLLLLLGCMMDCNSAELMVLMMERGPELHAIMKDVLTLSFPKESVLPKRKARRAKDKVRRRR